ncbi:MAG: hypothetical protein E5Y30_15835 [Mesorhizobium sp.]|nr:MAG: hypothetical protein E5Y30_15835 [Mesorhizobium sp.]
MFFTKLARVIAWVFVIFGGLRAAVGFTAAFTENPALVARYLGSGSVGENIDKGVLYFLIGVAAGMVADISRSIAARTDVPK